MRDENIVISHESEAGISIFMSKVYAWMTGALVLSALVAWQAATSTAFIEYMTTHAPLFYGLMIGELVLVIALAGFVKRMPLGLAITAFVLYSAVTGLTLSTIFLVYTASSIAKAFFITAGMFGTMSFYGYVTRKDLTNFGSFLFMSLIGLIIASLVNLFLHSPMIDWITTYAGIIIFTGLAAYDTQKLKYFGLMAMEEDMFAKMAILGALTLYLDFINLFLSLLRAFGDRR